jgi:hypothetical protein
MLFQSILANNHKMNYPHNIRNVGLRFIVFKEKTYPKMLQIINRQYKIYYDKTIYFMNDQYKNYENLSPEDKHLVEFMFSLLL